MRFLIDNALSPKLTIKLNEANYNAVHVREYAMSAAEDEIIFERASDENRIIISADSSKLYGQICPITGLCGVSSAMAKLQPPLSRQPKRSGVLYYSISCLMYFEVISPVFPLCSRVL